MGFEMRHLRITSHSTKTLVWWFNRREQIDFSPPYQRRGSVWSQDDKAYLIDSIINGFDVPKLYLADFQIGDSRLNVSKLPYAIIDGKQRFEAIFDFFQNKVPLRRDFKYRKDDQVHAGGAYLKDLREVFPKIAEEFENASLDIMSVFAEDEEDINEIFVRLNRSKPLTGAEVRNALTGEVPKAIRLLASHPFFRVSTKFSSLRAADLNAAAKILLFEYSGGPTSTKKSDLDSFAAFVDGDDAKLEASYRTALNVLDGMRSVFVASDPLLSTSGPVPVYYWFVRSVLHEDTLGSVRPFLLDFEELRRRNRDVKSNGASGEVNFDLATYDSLSRSVNDVSSQTGRVEILLKMFSVWLHSKQQFFSLVR